MKKKLGYYAKDQITGFQGIITGFACYITGCDQVCLTPTAKEDNSLADGRWFDINRITIVGDKPYVKLDTETNKGGPTGAEQARTY